MKIEKLSGQTRRPLIRAVKSNGQRARAEDWLASSIWLRLMKSYNLVLRQARRSLAANCTIAQFDVLAQLARHPEGFSFSQLSRELFVTAGNLTGIVDRLERDGLVSRKQLPRDRRSFQLQLTREGRALIKKLVSKHTRDLNAVLKVLGRDELLQLRELLGRLQQGLETKY